MLLKPVKTLLSASCAGLLLLLVAFAAQAEPVKITFLHTNDVYEIAPKGGKGGLAELMTLIKAERAANPNSITTFGGDLISPSILSQMLKGTQMIDLMNRLGVQVAVPGNHEYDFGPEVALKRFGESTFPWLGTNVLGRGGNSAPGLRRWQVLEVGGYKIGFFGLLAPETDTLSSPGEGIAFGPVLKTAATAVRALREDGADIIVALTHLDLAVDRELVKTVEGIDLVLGGHDHDPIAIYERGVLIQKAGTDAHYLAAVDLTVDRVKKGDKTNVVVLPEWRLISTAGVAPDPEVQQVVVAYNKRLDEELGQPVGQTTVALDTRRATVRTAESAFANLMADAMRAGVGGDLALTNGGGIRGDRTYDPGTTLTRKDILGELPFGNLVVLIELSGADLMAALENGVSEVENIGGRYPHLSGMTVTYDPKAAKGKRIVTAKVGAEALDSQKLYKVATNDYIFGGGDGYAALTRGKPLIDPSGAKLMATMVMEYIAAKGSIAPVPEGRLKPK